MFFRKRNYIQSISKALSNRANMWATVTETIFYSRSGYPKKYTCIVRNIFQKFFLTTFKWPQSNRFKNLIWTPYGNHACCSEFIAIISRKLSSDNYRRSFVTISLCWKDMTVFFKNSSTEQFSPQPI